MKTTLNRTVASITLTAATVFSGLLSSQLHADTTLQPFEATYKVVSEGTINMTGESLRSLQQEDSNWRLVSKASAFVASIEESSLFAYQQTSIQPLSYHYNRKVLGKTRTANLTFDWQKNTVTNNVENKPWTMDIQPGVLDKLSYQLQLQADIAAGKTSLDYKVADGGRLKHYSFSVAGTEQIETPAGTFNAIRVERVYDDAGERQTLIWFAPELDYQLVKLYRQEKKDKTYSLILKRNQKI